MKLISIIGKELNQVMKVSVPETGLDIDMQLRYVTNQSGWFVSIQYQDFTLKNFRIVTSGNILHQFRNLVPFGLSCIVEQDQEPLDQNDFVSGRAKLYLLTSAEVDAFHEVLNGQATT